MSLAEAAELIVKNLVENANYQWINIDSSAGFQFIQRGCESL